MQKQKVRFLVIGLVFLFCISFAYAEVLQSCPYLDNDNAGVYWGKNGLAQTEHAESFELNAPANITGVVIYVWKGGEIAPEAGALTVRIETDNGTFAPSGTLANVAFNHTLDFVIAANQYINITFNNTGLLSAGVRYWLVLNSTEAIDNHLIRVGHNTTGNCTGTAQWRADSLNWQNSTWNDLFYHLLGVSYPFPTWVNGGTNYSNNTLPQYLNFTCGGGTYNLWFGNTNPPTWWVLQNAAFGNYTIDSTNITSEGKYYYIANCGATNTSVLSFTYDFSNPSITINSNNFFNESNSSRINQYIDVLALLNISFFDSLSNLYGIEINITNSTGGVKYNLTNETLTMNNYTLFRKINTSTWEQNEQFTISVFVSDSHTANVIPPYKVTKANSKLIFDTTEGNKITIESKALSTTASTKRKDRYTFEFAFFNIEKSNKEFILSSNNKLQYIQNSKYKGHFVVWNKENKKGNWIDFEGLEKSPTITKINDSVYSIIFNDVGSNVAFNSIGGMNYANATYSWYKGKLLAISPNTTSGVGVNLELYLNKNNKILSTQTALFYNGTEYPPIKYYASALDNYLYGVPSLIVYNDTNKTIIWGVNITQFDGNMYTFNYTTQHSISNFFIDNCTASTTKTLSVNFFNLNDEKINVNYSGSIFYTYSGITSNNTYYFINTQNVSYCIYPTWINLASSISIQYQHSSITSNYYSTTTLNNSEKIVNLYLDTTAPTEITATVYNAYGKALADCYIDVQKKDTATGNYISTGIYKSNFEGQTKFYAVLNTVLYKFLLYYPSGTLRKTTSADYLYSTSPSFIVQTNDNVLDDYYKQQAIYSNLTFLNDTTRFKYVYSDSSSSLSLACLKVYIQKLNDNELYNLSCIYAVSGTIFVPITNVSGRTYYAKSFLTINGVETLMNTYSVDYPDSDVLNIIGIVGLIALTIMTIAFAFLITSSISLSVLLIPLPALLLSSIKFIAFDLSMCIGLEVCALIIAIIIDKW